MLDNTTVDNPTIAKRKRFIQSLYCDLLGRDSIDDATIEHWLEQFESGLDAEDIFAVFIACDEYTGKLAQQYKFFEPPGHFYSPIVDVEEIRPRASIIFDRNLLPSGIDMREDAQIAYARTMSVHYPLLPFPDQHSPGSRYFYENGVFSYLDAITLACTILEHKPKRILEVGSGYSSAATLDIVEKLLDWKVELTFAEPYPALLRSLMKDGDEERVTVIGEPVQAIDIALFTELEPNDILFIDSTHVVKTGSDVVHHFTKVLPRVKPGVLIHIHDMFYPFEYPREWVIDQNRSWNEVYLVEAFLSGNPEYEILFFNDYMASKQGALLSQLMPKSMLNSGGSLWLRKLPAPRPPTLIDVVKDKFRPKRKPTSRS